MHWLRRLVFDRDFLSVDAGDRRGWEVAAVFSLDEERILQEIERGLRQDDRWFATRLTMRSAAFSLRRRWVLTLIAVELGLVAIAVVGALVNQPALIVLGAGIAVVTAMATIMVRLAVTDPPDTSGDPPPIMWLW